MIQIRVIIEIMLVNISSLFINPRCLSIFELSDGSRWRQVVRSERKICPNRESISDLGHLKSSSGRRHWVCAEMVLLSSRRLHQQVCCSVRTSVLCCQSSHIPQRQNSCRNSCNSQRKSIQVLGTVLVQGVKKPPIFFWRTPIDCGSMQKGCF